MENILSLEKQSVFASHTEIENIETDGILTLRVVKKDKLNEYDQNTYAKACGVDFHNGVIEARLLSRLLPDAPDFARGFIGIVFRAKEDDAEFESFYVRPTNGRGCTDPVRRSHGCQYFSYPGYTFDYFREFGITKYEAPVNIGLNEWFWLKAEIQGTQGDFYINGDHVLAVKDLKHNADSRGSVGIFVDIGTEAFVSELKVTYWD